MVVFQDPGCVPQNWRQVFKGNLEEGSSSSWSDNDPSESLASTWPPSEGIEGRPAVAFCNNCQNANPPRCHHCSVC